MAGDILPSLERITNKILAIQIALKHSPVPCLPCLDDPRNKRSYRRGLNTSPGPSPQYISRENLEDSVLLEYE